MKHLIDSVKSSIKTENWYAALILTLTLPDIAGKIEYPNSTSGDRYADWFNHYVGNNYKSMMGPQRIEHIFLSGDDCYALRCSFLHEGKSEIKHQRARDILEDFIFIAPVQGSYFHCNQTNDKLQLQVDVFCGDIINGVRQWLEDISADAKKQLDLNNLLEIHQIQGTAFKF